MILLHRLASIVHWLVHRNGAEQDLDDELQAFVDMAAADNVRDGAAPVDARRIAVLDLGGVEQTKSASDPLATAPGSTRSRETCVTPCACALEVLRSAPLS